MNAATSELASLAETRRFGECLGRVAAAGDLVLLSGGLGAGKTTLTQGIAAGLGIDPLTVVSPTFTLLQEHRGGRLPLYHLDVYRLQNSSELENLAFDDYLLLADGVIVMEWAERVLGALPGDYLSITMGEGQSGPDSRSAAVSAAGTGSQALLKRWQTALCH